MVSKDELLSLFCETPSFWGEHQNTSCLGFEKGPRFLNIVMTFVLHPLSHYNSITEPRARFLLSLLEDPSINFLSHFILSLMMFIKIRRPVINLFFLRLSRGSFIIFLSLSLILISLPSCVPLVQHLFDRARPSFNRSSHGPRLRILLPLPFHLPLLFLRVVV